MLVGDKLEGVAVDGVPVGVGGEVEGAVGRATAAAATEKNAGIARHLIAGDGDVLEDLLLDDVVVLVEGGDGKLGQHVVHRQHVAALIGVTAARSTLVACYRRNAGTARTKLFCSSF